jgi:hypothetical protein
VSTHQVAYAQKRRSTRIDQAIPLIVQGVGALREPYHENVSTVQISCHGCTYISKHEVIQGETVYLDVKHSNNGSAVCSSRARVKWAQKLASNKEKIFQIAVELEIAGNIWGIPAPPVDWFPPQIPEAVAVDSASQGRELKVVARKEQPIAPAADTGSNRVSSSPVNPAPIKRIEAAATPVPAIAQLMVGFGEQIQTMAAEAAAAALVREKTRLFEEFRAQLRDEAMKAIHSAISASKEVIARQAMKEFNEAQEAGAKNSHATWRKKIEQDMESARQHLLTQEKEASQRMDAMATSTIERVQSKMDATRSEAVERFVSRIRDQVSPMLEQTKTSLQKLQGAESALRKESEAIFAGLENQLAYSTNEILAKSEEDLGKKGAAITAKTSETLQRLYQSFEKAAHDNANVLLASMGNQMTKMLQEKAAEISREYSKGLEGYTREYLQSISKSIVEISQKVSSSGR